jgi:hypothetical protein
MDACDDRRGHCFAFVPPLAFLATGRVEMKISGDAFPLFPIQAGKPVPGQAALDGAHGVLGWDAFLDARFMASSFGVLALAALLGAVIGFHPATRRTIDKLHEADMPHVYVMYAVIGAIIGVAVREFGMVVGVVVFGIGGLIRFRSSTDSTRDTVRLIIVTLAGLIAGLGLLPFAVMTTLFAFVLIYLFDSSPAYRIRIEGLPDGRAADCANVYRDVLKEQRCKIIAEHHSLGKGRIEFVFRLPRLRTRDHLDTSLRGIAPDLRGEVDWEVS